MVLYSLIDLGKAYNLCPKKPTEKKSYCRKCGGQMRHVNNVLICDIEVKCPGDDGKILKSGCGNIIIQKIHRQSGALLAPGECPENLLQYEQTSGRSQKPRK